VQGRNAEEVVASESLGDHGRCRLVNCVSFHGRSTGRATHINLWRGRAQRIDEALGRHNHLRRLPQNERLARCRSGAMGKVPDKVYDGLREHGQQKDIPGSLKGAES